MKIIQKLVTSNIKRILRNRGLLFATVFFPLIFIGVFGIAFQSGQLTTSPVEIGMISIDTGIPAGAIMVNHSFGMVQDTDLQDTYTDLLSELTYEDNKTKLFDITQYTMDSEDEAKKLIEQGQLSALIYIPSDFSRGLMATFRSQYKNDSTIISMTNQWQQYPQEDFKTQIDLIGDQSLQGFGIASSVISQFTAVYFDFSNLPQNYAVEIDGSIDTDDLTAFDFILPGLVVFGLMQTLGIVATAALRDVESGLLGRLHISSMAPSNYVIALIISQLMISLVQIPIFFGAATLFGFPISSQILVAFIFAALIALSMTGIGLIIAALVETADSANTVANMISTPMAFLAGAFFTVPNPVLLSNFFGNSLGIMDLLPPTSAIQGLRLVLIGGRSVTEVAFHLALLSSLTLLLLVAGLILYSRKHFMTSN